jgi:hypothetical protein
VAAFDLGIHRALRQTPLRAGILALLRIVELTMQKPNWPATRNIFILLTAGRHWPVMAICTKPRFAGSGKRGTIWQHNCEVPITSPRPLNAPKLVSVNVGTKLLALNPIKQLPCQILTWFCPNSQYRLSPICHLGSVAIYGICAKLIATSDRVSPVKRPAGYSIVTVRA